MAFVEQNLREKLREPKAVPYARRISGGHFLLEISNDQGVHTLKRQRGGNRVLKPFEPLLSLLAGLGVVEFAIILDSAKVTPGAPVMPRSRTVNQDEISHASWRHDFEIPF